jgi:signal-transduction protein with cAMP-binding, CBS, and nucleotidyltransferase domain
MNEVELSKKLDILLNMMTQLTEAVKQLSAEYKESIVKTMTDLNEVVKSKDFMKSYADDLKRVLDELKKIRMVRQPNVFHEEIVTPKAIRERVIKKGLDSPTALIHNILLGGVQPIEVLGALSVIREKGRQRWS